LLTALLILSCEDLSFLDDLPQFDNIEESIPQKALEELLELFFIQYSISIFICGMKESFHRSFRRWVETKLLIQCSSACVNFLPIQGTPFVRIKSLEIFFAGVTKHVWATQKGSYVLGIIWIGLFHDVAGEIS
jgi:hypothetical protein